jgi:hypothetical protein
MSASNPFNEDPGEANQYEIRIQGRLDSRWAAWFEGLTLTPQENGDTLISGKVVDQAALLGLLRKVRDAGMRLISVNLISPTRGNPPETDKNRE